MAPITNQMINAQREAECKAITYERKYIKSGDSFIKRTLRPDEWQINPINGNYQIPRLDHARLLNEADCMEFIADNTNIPVAEKWACYKDAGAVHLVTEYIDGVAMSELTEEQRKVVEKELEGHLKTLKSLKSDTWGGPREGIVIPPFRVMKNAYRQEWKMKKRASKDLVFCHNDLGAHNVIVDPKTLKIQAIIDWEYAGFFPPEFEAMFFRRPGPSVAIDGEKNDEEELEKLMRNNLEL